jgi:transcriptional regulator with XRE-family HTH domain
MTGDTIKILRTAEKLSTRDFARKINVHYSLISRMEGGDRRVTEKIQKRIVVAFGLTDEKLYAIKLLINQFKN